MKQLLIMLLVAGFTFIFLGCTENNPTLPELNQNDAVTNAMDKKLPRLVGDLDCTFDVARAPYFWQGTINFRGIGVYGIRWESLGPPDDDGTYLHFSENFEIYELGNMNNVCLYGPDAGVIRKIDGRTFAQGEVTETNGAFAMWLGSNSNFTGIVTWVTVGLPESFNGTFRFYFEN